jgi:hypothetical protein
MSYPAKSHAAVDTEVSLGINTLFEQPWWLDAVAPGAWGGGRGVEGRQSGGTTALRNGEKAPW